MPKGKRASSRLHALRRSFRIASGNSIGSHLLLGASNVAVALLQPHPRLHCGSSSVTSCSDVSLKCLRSGRRPETLRGASGIGHSGLSFRAAGIAGTSRTSSQPR